MTALPDWMVSHPEGLTVADYDALPEEISRRVEIIDGAIVVNAAPRRAHQVIARRLANALDAVASKRLAVATDVDLRLRDARREHGQRRARPDHLPLPPRPDHADLRLGRY